MALSGNFNKYGYGGYSNLGLYVSWSASQSVSGNYSDVTVNVYMRSWNTSHSASNVTVTAFGVSKTFTGAAVNDNNSTWNNILLGSTTLRVNHDSAGKKSGTISASWAFNGYIDSTYVGNMTATSGSITLNQIPRGATITAAPNFTDEENPTITYSNPAGSAVSALEACISFDGSKDDVAYRSISKTGTSYTFNLTTAERNVLRAGVKSGNTCQVIFYIRTKIGDSTQHSTSYKTLTLVNYTPTLSPVAEVSTSSTTYSLTGSQTTFIKNYTDVSVNTGAVARKGATLSSQKIVNGGKTIWAGSGTMYSVDNPTFTFTATDSRGNTTTQTLTRNLVDYVRITCNMKASIDTAGTATLVASGNFYVGSFGAVDNDITVYYRFAEQGDNIEDQTWDIFQNTVSVAGAGATTYEVVQELYGLDYRKAYTFQLKAVDKLFTAESATETIIALPLFDWGESSFNFNVPIHINNEPMADFIVDQGTSGIWTYRLWNSGIAECWGTKSVSTGVTTAWGSLYVSGALSSSNVEYPFEFVEVPMVNVNLRPNGSGAFVIASGASTASTTATGGFEIVRGTERSTITYHISYDVKGRWK